MQNFDYSVAAALAFKMLGDKIFHFSPANPQQTFNSAEIQPITVI